MIPPKRFTREYLTEDSWLDQGHLPSKLNISDPDDFALLWDLHPSTHSEVRMGSRMVPIPRWQQSYIRDYKFSGNTAKAEDLPEELEPYLKWADSLNYGEFNQFLVNWYEDGNHYIGPHADNTRPLVPDSPIITISICPSGTPRKFRIRNIGDKEIVRDVETTNGLVLVMGGAFQKEFKHEIVKITGKKAMEAGPRISITLRQFK